MTKITVWKSTFKKMEDEWRNYHLTVTDIYLLREEIKNPTKETDENTGGGQSNIMGSPTESMGLQLATNKQLAYMTDIVQVIERVYNGLPNDYKKLVRLRYWSPNNERQWIGIAAELGVSDRQAIRWRNEIIQASIEVLGWR